MRCHKQLVVGFVAVFVALAAGFYMGDVLRSPTPPVALLLHEELSQILSKPLADTEGGRQSLMQWQGKILVINFWATWCPPCREEMPAFSRLQRVYDVNSVQFVGISQDSAENVINYSRQHPVSYPLLIAMDEGLEMSRLLGNSSLVLPYTIVFDTQRVIRLAKQGRVSEHDLDAMLQTLTKN